MKKELKNTTALVKEILEEVPETRNSDPLLYYYVCNRLNRGALGKAFGMVLLTMKENGLPGFETVRRSRQKLQAEYPELAGDSKVEAQRMLNEEVFREYARSNA